MKNMGILELCKKNESGADFQARVKGLYGQTSEPDRENNFTALPKAWNQSDPTLVVMEPRV